MQQWIKKKHYKMQHHAKAKHRYLDFPVKSKPKTHWQIFLRCFGGTEGSQTVIFPFQISQEEGGPGVFNKAASETYKNIDEEKLQEERRG